MKNEKIYKIIIIIAIAVDLVIFGSLIYSNKRLKNEVDILSKKILNLEEILREQGAQVHNPCWLQ